MDKYKGGAEAAKVHTGTVECRRHPRGDRWTPIITRELCFGTRSFGELLDAAPLISRTVLAQRLKQLEQSGVVYIEPKPGSKGHLYRLTPALKTLRYSAFPTSTTLAA